MLVDVEGSDLRQTVPNHVGIWSTFITGSLRVPGPFERKVLNILSYGKFPPGSVGV